MTAELRAFWRAAPRLSRAALVATGCAAVAHVAGLLGVGSEQAAGVAGVLHLAVLGLGVAAIATGLLPSMVGVRAPSAPPRVPLPRGLVRLSVALGVYFLAWFVGVFAAYGEGGPERRGGRDVWVARGRVVRTLGPGEREAFDARVLGVFSAGWAAFALPLALLHFRLAAQRRWLREAGRAGGAPAR